MKEYIRFWFNEVVENLRSIWHLIFHTKTESVEFNFKDKRTRLSLMMFKYYDEKGYFKQLFANILEISNTPHFQIESAIVLRRPDEISFIKPYEHYKIEMAKRGEVSQILTCEPKLSIRTNENIFLAVFLERVINDLSNLGCFLRGKIEKFKEDDKEIALLREDLEYQRYITKILTEMNEKVLLWRKKFLNLRFGTFLNEIPTNLPLPDFTHRLYMLPLYRKVFDFFRQYSRYLIRDNQIELTVLDENKIYELWCLFKLRDVLNNICGDYCFTCKDIEEDIIYDAEKNIFERCWEFEFEDGLKLIFQKHFGPDTTDFRVVSTEKRPDFVIHYRAKNGIIIFDAKKMKFAELSGRKVADEKIYREASAFDQMHIYRDNIRDRDYNHCVKYGIILYPFETEGEPEMLKFIGDWNDRFKKYGLFCVKLADDNDLISLREVIENTIFAIK